MGSIDLDLSECPGRFIFDVRLTVVGIDAKSDIAFQIVPVFAALKYNTYFRGVIVNDSIRKDAIALLADSLRGNSTLTRVKVRNVGGEEKAFVELGAALKENKKHTVQILNLSENIIGNKGVISIGEALQQWSHALRVLDLSNCRIGGKQ
jgi:Ran GTPase-activating protein (RanGAP) involved in mRNA processing and transport